MQRFIIPSPNSKHPESFCYAICPFRPGVFNSPDKIRLDYWLYGGERSVVYAINRDATKLRDLKMMAQDIVPIEAVREDDVTRVETTLGRYSRGQFLRSERGQEIFHITPVHLVNTEVRQPHPVDVHADVHTLEELRKSTL